jgi:hypothetical protein
MFLKEASAWSDATRLIKLASLYLLCVVGSTYEFLPFLGTIMYTEFIVTSILQDNRRCQQANLLMLLCNVQSGC